VQIRYVNACQRSRRFTNPSQKRLKELGEEVSDAEDEDDDDDEDEDEDDEDDE
jgi:hypothetical protein